MSNPLSFDCWHLICTFLRQEDHVNLANTSLFLRSVVGEHYGAQKSYNFELKKIKYSKHKLHEFLEAIGRNLEELTVENCTLKLFFAILSLPPTVKLQRLNIKFNNKSLKDLRALRLFNKNLTSKLGWQEFRHFELDATIFELCLAKKFPHLKALSLCPTTGINIWKFPKLDELEIGVGSITKADYLHKIFSTLSLKKLKITRFEKPYCSKFLFDFDVFRLKLFETLEVLDIENRCIGNQTIKEINQFKKLRKIVFNIVEPECCVDCHIFNQQQVGEMHFLKALLNIEAPITTLTLNRVPVRFAPFLEHVYARKMHNLTSLTFCGGTFCTEELLAAIIRISSHSLREFRFVGAYINDSMWLLDIIRRCKNLEIFEVSQNFICDLEFLYEAISVMRFGGTDERKGPLLFRCFKTPIKPYHLEELSVIIPDGMQISLEEEILELPSRNEFIAVEFNN